MTTKFVHILDAIKSDPFRRNVDIALAVGTSPVYVSRVRQLSGIPKRSRPKTKNYKVTLSPEMAAWVDREARNNKVSPSLFLASCITDAFVEATE